MLGGPAAAYSGGREREPPGTPDWRVVVAAPDDPFEKRCAALLERVVTGDPRWFEDALGAERPAHVVVERLASAAAAADGPLEVRRADGAESLPASVDEAALACLEAAGAGRCVHVTVRDAPTPGAPTDDGPTEWHAALHRAEPWLLAAVRLAPPVRPSAVCVLVQRQDGTWFRME